MKTELTTVEKISVDNRAGAEELRDATQDTVSNATVVALVAALAVLGIVLWILVVMRFRG